jgi:hypothetical protein
MAEKYRVTIHIIKFFRHLVKLNHTKGLNSTNKRTRIYSKSTTKTTTNSMAVNCIQLRHQTYRTASMRQITLNLQGIPVKTDVYTPVHY